MSTRKQFIAAAAAVPFLGAAPAPPSPRPSATASAAAPARGKRIAPAARDLAAQMRAFDPALSARQLREIASGIDDNLKIGTQVNPKGRTLRNWDEPAATFEVPE